MRLASFRIDFFMELEIPLGLSKGHAGSGRVKKWFGNAGGSYRRW
jgi:hypothetical protein